VSRRRQRRRRRLQPRVERLPRSTRRPAPGADDVTAETDLLPCPWCKDARVQAYYDDIRHTGYVCCMNHFPKNAQCGRTIVVSISVDYNTPEKVKKEASRRWNQQA